MKLLPFTVSLFFTAAAVLSGCSSTPLSVGQEMDGGGGHEIDGGSDAVSAAGQDSGGFGAMEGGSDGQANGSCPSVMPENNLACSDLDAGACLYPGQNCGSPGGGPDFTYFCTCTAEGWYCTGGC
jgi:hypothetical protein